MNIEYDEALNWHFIQLPREVVCQPEPEEWCNANIEWVADTPTLTSNWQLKLYASFDDLILFKLRWQGVFPPITEPLDAGAFYAPYVPLTYASIKAPVASLPPVVTTNLAPLKVYHDPNPTIDPIVSFKTATGH